MILHQIFKKFDSNVKQLQNYFVLFIFMIYPLILLDIEYNIVSLKALVLFSVIILISAGFGYLIFKKNAEIKRISNLMEIFFLIVGCFSLLFLVYMLFSNLFDINVFSGTLILFLYLVLVIVFMKNAPFYDEYFLVLIFSGVIVFLQLMVYFIINNSYIEPIRIMIKDKDSLASFTMLIGIVSNLQYCKCTISIRKLFYILVSALSFFILFIIQNYASIILAFLFIIFIPLFYIPTAERIKRVAQLVFIYLFILSNMSVITNNTEILFLTKIKYNVMTSVYINLILCCLAIWFFYFWNHVEDWMDRHKLIMKKMFKSYLVVIKIIIISLVLIILNNDWNQLALNKENVNWTSIFGFLNKTLTSRNGTGYQVMQYYGMIGLILLIIGVSFVWIQLKNNFNKFKPLTTDLVVISIFYIIQSIFFKQQLITSPIYAVILIYACFYQENKINYKFISINSLNKDNIINP